MRRINIFRHVNINKVFTPNTAAKLSYIPRQSLESRICSSLSIPGKQIILYGDSGSGKTTILHHITEENKIKVVKTICSSDMTFNDLLEDVYRKLNIFVQQDEAYGLSGGMKSKKSLLEVSAEQNKSFKRVADPSCSIDMLPKYMHDMHVQCWQIDDFHKVPSECKQKLADSLKKFIDMANDYSDVRIVCIGAVDSATKLIELSPDLENRVSQIRIPLFESEIIKKILVKGFDFLNVTVSENVISSIVFYSNNLASIAHQMAYDICKKCGINKSQTFNKKIEDKAIEYGINGYLEQNEGTLRKVYELATTNSSAWYILKTFSTINREYLTFQDIKSAIITKRNKHKHITEEIIKNDLTTLCGMENPVIYFNEDFQKYSLTSPIWGSFLKMQLHKEDVQNQDKRQGRRSIQFISQKTPDSYLLKVFSEVARNALFLNGIPELNNMQLDNQLLDIDHKISVSEK